jgi:hypothetical protein
LIMKNRKFSCKDFVCYFDIWSSGGPNWQHEEFAWYKEQENEWTLVQGRDHTRSKQMSLVQGRNHYLRLPHAKFFHRHSSYRLRSNQGNIQGNPPLSGANRVPIGLRQNSVSITRSS